jgi:PAS domain S-box-containing protein
MDSMEALQSENEKLELIIASTHAGIWDWKIADGLEWWSPRLYEMIGFEPGEIKVSFDFFLNVLLHADDRPVLQEALEQHFTQGKAFRLEIRLQHKNGEYRWFETSGKASFDTSGKPRRMSGSIIDITENKNLRLELEKREFLLQEVSAMTQAGGWELDLINRQTRWSKELYDIFEVEYGFLPSMEKIMDFFAPGSVLLIRQKLRAALREGQAWNEELKCLTSRKRELWVQSIGKPLFDDSGTVIGLRGVLQVINDRKIAEQRLVASEEKFRKMFERSPVGMTLTNLETGSFEEYNQSFLDSTGYTAEELKSVSFQQLTPEEFMPASRLQVQILLKQGVNGPFEMELTARNGQRFPVLVNGILIENMAGRSLVWSFFQDISNIKKREQLIEALNAELRALNAQKDRLFSIISHDLKGPVGNTDILLDFLAAAASDWPEETREILRKTKLSSASAKGLLEDLLLWARSQMEKVPFKPVTLALEPIVALVFKTLQAQADFKSLQLLTDIPAGTTVKADEGMLRVILRNLLSNAIKYSFPGGKITLTVRESEGVVTTAIRDEGIGISPENLEELFDKDKHFTTPGTTGEKGSGLGLMLCQEFVRKHGGSISIESQEYKGCTLTFSLPSQ